LKLSLGFSSKRVDDKLWDKIVKECDEDGDGSISFEEFKNIMQ